MRHSDEQINEAAERFEKLADRLDPATAQAEDVSALQQCCALCAEPTQRKFTEDPRMGQHLTIRQ